MERAEARSAIRVAVQAEMGDRGWNIAQLREATGVDAGTLGDFLAGQRWPRIKTLGAIERGLGWPAGTVAAMLAGAPAPSVGGRQVVDDPLRQEILDHPRLSDRDKRILLAQYDAMLADRPAPEGVESDSHRIRA